MEILTLAGKMLQWNRGVVGMFFLKLETDEKINGEPPPIIYIRGERIRFHNALLTMINKLRLKIHKIELQETGLLIDRNIKFDTIVFLIQNKTELLHRANTLIIGMTYENFLDIIFELEQLAFSATTVFFEYKWIENLYSGSIILESI